MLADALRLIISWKINKAAVPAVISEILSIGARHGFGRPQNNLFCISILAHPAVLDARLFARLRVPDASRRICARLL